MRDYQYLYLVDKALGKSHRKLITQKLVPL